MAWEGTRFVLDLSMSLLIWCQTLREVASFREPSLPSAQFLGLKLKNLVGTYRDIYGH